MLVLLGSLLLLLAGVRGLEGEMCGLYVSMIRVIVLCTLRAQPS